MKNAIFLLWGILMIFLAACGSGGEDRPSSPVATETAVSTLPTGTPISSEPAATIPADPVSTVTATPEPAPTFTPEAEPAADTESYYSQTACDHPYFPLREGATWTFADSINGTTINWLITEISGDRGNATAIMQITITGGAEEIRLDYTWQCSAAAGIASFDYATLNSINTGPGQITLEMQNASGEGVQFLPADQLLPGVTWNMTTEGIFRMNLNAAGTALQADGTMQVRMVNIVLNDDPVVFGGHTLPALVIQRDMTIANQINMSGMAISMPELTFNLRNVATMAYGIGPVSQSTTSDFANEELTLISYEIP